MDIFTYRPVRDGSQWFSENFRSAREFGQLVEKVAGALAEEEIQNVA